MFFICPIALVVSACWPAVLGKSRPGGLPGCKDSSDEDLPRSAVRFRSGHISAPDVG
jgi:hypothetical protein